MIQPSARLTALHHEISRIHMRIQPTYPVHAMKFLCRCANIPSSCADRYLTRYPSAKCNRRSGQTLARCGHQDRGQGLPGTDYFQHPIRDTCLRRLATVGLSLFAQSSPIFQSPTNCGHSPRWGQPEMMFSDVGEFLFFISSMLRVSLKFYTCLVQYKR